MKTLFKEKRISSCQEYDESLSLGPQRLYKNFGVGTYAPLRRPRIPLFKGGESVIRLSLGRRLVNLLEPNGLMPSHLPIFSKYIGKPVDTRGLFSPSGWQHNVRPFGRCFHHSYPTLYKKNWSKNTGVFCLYPRLTSKAGGIPPFDHFPPINPSSIANNTVSYIISK